MQRDKDNNLKDGLFFKEDNDEQKDNMVIKYSKFAIVGFILSMLSVFGLTLFGIIGAVLGYIALVHMNYNSEKGKGLAIAAIIVGVIWGLAASFVKILVAKGF